MPQSPVPSWRLKLRRAQEHLDEVQVLLEPFGKTRDYIVRESVKKDRRGRREWTYRLFSDLEPDPYLAVVLDDFMFDVGSALDHIAVALVPTSRKGKASFPIALIDPEASHPGDENRDADRRKAWDTATKGMPRRALDVVRNFQPYNADVPAGLRDLGLAPKDTVLAVLSAFQNADKHRRLVTTTSGLLPESVTVRDRASGNLLDFSLPVLAPTHLPENGTRVFRARSPVDVAASGATVAAVGIAKNPRGRYRRLPGFMTELMENAERLVEHLEPVIK